MRLLLCLALIVGLGSCEDVKVKTPKGVIKGTRVDHDFGQYYYAFRGIRYAKAPTEELRFMVLIPRFLPLVLNQTFSLICTRLLVILDRLIVPSS